MGDILDAFDEMGKEVQANRKEKQAEAEAAEHAKEEAKEEEKRHEEDKRQGML